MGAIYRVCQVGFFTGLLKFWLQLYLHERPEPKDGAAYPDSGEVSGQ